VLFQQFGGGLGIEEEIVHFLQVRGGHLSSTVRLCEDLCWGKELQRKPVWKPKKRGERGTYETTK